MAGSSGSGSITGHSHLKAELEQDPLPGSDTWLPVEWCTDYSLQAVLKRLTTCSSPKGSSLQPLVSAEDVGERLRGSIAPSALGPALGSDITVLVSSLEASH